MSLNDYLKDRKQKIILDLMIEHAGRCRAVGKSFVEVGKMIASGNKTNLTSRVAIIKTQERSADEIEAKLGLEVAVSNLPSKMADDLLLLVRKLDRAAGAAKRSVINLELIKDFDLPEKLAERIRESTEIINEIFIKMELGLRSISNEDKVYNICYEVNALETKIDVIYTELKRGYFEIEDAFKSSAALIILDHAFRDLESSADFGEDAAEILTTLVSRRG